LKKLKKIFYDRFYLIFFIFISACATGQSLISQNNIYIGMNKNQLRNVFLTSYLSEDPFLNDSFNRFYSNQNKEILAGSSQSVFFVFKNVTKPLKCGFLLCDYGNGTLESYHFNYNQAVDSIIQSNQKNTSTVKNNTKTTTDPIKGDTLQQLLELSRDFKSGKISKQEFESKKAEILK
jgi:hypothetical protein